MIRLGCSALRGASRGFLQRAQLPAISVFSCHFGNEADLNAKLKDYVLKQDLKKNFTEYKNAADRKELFQEVYLKLAKEGQTLKRASGSSDCGCLLCRIPDNLITYLNVGLLRLFIHESGSIYSHHVTGTCKKHQRKIVRCIKHARNAGLIPFQLTPTDYEMYDMMVGGKKSKLAASKAEEVEEPEEKDEEENSLADLLNKAESVGTMISEKGEGEGEEKEEGDMSSEDFVKLMNLLSAEEKDERDEA